MLSVLLAFKVVVPGYAVEIVLLMALILPFVAMGMGWVVTRVSAVSIVQLMLL